jgi:hypothetical protein
MTEEEIQDQLHTLYEGDNSTPSSTSSDYLARRNLLNVAVSVWEKEALWRELFVSLADAADGDTTTTADTSSYDCPSDFVSPVGFLRIGTSYYPYYSPEKYQMISSSDSSTRFYYITGNPNTGYDLHLHPTPSSTGDTITYEYYKTASTISATTDVLEMADPYFAVYFALSRLFENDGKSGEAQKAFIEANSRLQRMKEINMTMPFYQKNSVIDEAFNRGTGGFGK